MLMGATEVNLAMNRVLRAARWPHFAGHRSQGLNFRREDMLGCCPPRHTCLLRARTASRSQSPLAPLVLSGVGNPDFPPLINGGPIEAEEMSLEDVERIRASFRR